jgi:hypothetical protein
MVKQEKRFVPRVSVKWPVTMLSPLAQVEGKIETVSSKGALVSCKDMPPLEEGLLMVIWVPKYKTMNLNWRTLTRFSSAWVCNVRFQTPSRSFLPFQFPPLP